MKTNKPRFIYYVFGDDGTVRYVGCSVNPYARLRQHIYDAHTVAALGFLQLNQFSTWVLKEDIAGHRLNVCIVRPAGPNWEDTEREEIERLLDGGAPLLNTLIRGFPRRWTAEGRTVRRDGPCFRNPKETPAGLGIRKRDIRAPKHHRRDLLKRPRAKAAK